MKLIKLHWNWYKNKIKYEGRLVTVWVFVTVEREHGVSLGKWIQSAITRGINEHLWKKIKKLKRKHFFKKKRKRKKSTMFYKMRVCWTSLTSTNASQLININSIAISLLTRHHSHINSATILELFSTDFNILVY